MTTDLPLKFLGKVANPDDLLDYLNTLRTTNATKSSYSQGRKEIWIGKGSNLQSVKAERHKILTPENSPLVIPATKKVNQFCRKTFERATGTPNWDSCLFAKGAGIGWHRDHSIFRPISAIVNIGGDAIIEAMIDRYANEPGYESQSVYVGHGDIVGINTKHLHRSVVSDSNRAILLISQFR